MLIVLHKYYTEILSSKLQHIKITALKSGHENIVALLLRYGNTSMGPRVLSSAIQFGRRSSVKEFLQRYSVPKGYTWNNVRSASLIDINSAVELYFKEKKAHGKALPGGSTVMCKKPGWHRIEECENTHDIETRRFNPLNSNLFHTRECEIPPQQKKKYVRLTHSPTKNLPSYPTPLRLHPPANLPPSPTTACITTPTSPSSPLCPGKSASGYTPTSSARKRCGSGTRPKTTNGNTSAKPSQLPISPRKRKSSTAAKHSTTFSKTTAPAARSLKQRQTYGSCVFADRYIPRRHCYLTGSPGSSFKTM